MAPFNSPYSSTPETKSPFTAICSITYEANVSLPHFSGAPESSPQWKTYFGEPAFHSQPQHAREGPVLPLCHCNCPCGAQHLITVSYLFLSKPKPSLSASLSPSLPTTHTHSGHQSANQTGPTATFLPLGFHPLFPDVQLPQP